MTLGRSRNIFNLLLGLGLAFFLFSCGAAPVAKVAEVAEVVRKDHLPLQRIAFGSCNKTDLPQPLWEVISRNQPHLWIWGGDAVYADTSDMAVMKEKYQAQLSHPEYQAFLAMKIPILGTWDDHDYGVNDGGSDFASKKESQKLFLDFLGEPEESPRRLQEGIYSSAQFGPPGKLVKVLLLDGRYHKDNKNPQSDYLGQAQWDWLEKEIKTSTAQIHLIVSGIQIIPDQHRFEKWANFPKARERLFQLFSQYKVPGVIFISGDRHIAEISQTSQGLPYPIYEVTASGLTHSYIPLKSEYNPYRQGNFFKELNFGTIEIDWDKNPVQLKLQVRNIKNEIPLEVSLTLADLTAKK